MVRPSSPQICVATEEASRSISIIGISVRLGRDGHGFEFSLGCRQLGSSIAVHPNRGPLKYTLSPI
jgi:hypothetical protein